VIEDQRHLTSDGPMTRWLGDPILILDPIQFLGELMAKKLGGVVALVGLCALSLFLVNCGSSSSRPAGVLYVLTQGNNSVGNYVSTFAMDLNSGGLSLVNSNASTCPTAASSTNPNPCGLPVDILLDSTGRTAFVLDQGAPPCPGCSPPSNIPIAPAIYPYTVGSDGSLSAPGTAVTWTCAGTLVSNCSDTATAMVRDGGHLFVIDYGSSPTPGYPIPTPASPSCPHVPSGPYDVCPSISVFTISSGSLSLAAGSPFYLSKIPSALSAITFTPSGGTAEELLFVTNNQDICTQGCIAPSPGNDNTVSVYVVNPDSTLSERTNSPYAVAAQDPISVLAVNTNPATQNSGGLFVYVGNKVSSGLYPFEVCIVVDNVNCKDPQVADNLMFPLRTCPDVSCDVPPSSAGQSPIAMVVDPTNKFLYAVAYGSGQVYGFTINTGAGTLTALSPPYLPTGSQPVSMALHPTVNNTGQFLYTSNSASSNISGFVLSTTSGEMGALPSPTVTLTPPSGMTAR
jgi:Lactonase, 7-bladed beta-propeller